MHGDPKQHPSARCGVAIGLSALVAMLSLYGCGGDGDNRVGDGRLHFVSSANHHTLDPQQMSWMHDIRIADCLFEPLLVLSVPDLELQPGAAASWAVSEDGLTYTFHLRENGRWSNGDPVKASDFIYAWRRALLPGSAAQYSMLFFDISGARDFFDWRAREIDAYLDNPGQRTSEELMRDVHEHFAATVGLRAINDLTLEVRLEHPVPYFPQLVSFATFAPVHEPSVARLTAVQSRTGLIQTDPAWTRPGVMVSNGPYMLESWRPEQRLELAPNPYYHARDQVANAGIVEHITSNEQTALLLYQQGQVHWLPDIPTAKPIVAQLLAADRADTHVIPAAGTYFYNFNCLPKLPSGQLNPLADPRVRRAFSMAIDRKTIVDQVTRLGDRQPIARTFIPPDALPDYQPPIEAGIDYNPTRARELLAEAGYPDGVGLDGLSILYNTGAGHETIAQQIQAVWRQQLGVSVKLEAMESKVFGQRLRSQGFSIARASWFGDYQDPTTFLDKWRIDNGNNDAAYSNPVYDALLDEAARTRDPAQRMHRLALAEATLLADQPLAPIYHYVRFEMFDPRRVQGLAPNPWNRHRLEQVSLVSP